MVGVGVVLAFGGYTLIYDGYLKIKSIPGISLFDLVLPSHRTAVVSALAAGGAAPAASKPSVAGTVIHDTGAVASATASGKLSGFTYVDKAYDWIKGIF
jgi:hypothetical protein